MAMFILIFFFITILYYLIRIYTYIIAIIFMKKNGQKNLHAVTIRLVYNYCVILHKMMGSSL